MKVLSSEGGQMGLYAWKQEVYELQKFIKEKRGLGENEIISSELMFCGLGIPLIYRFFLIQNGKEDQPKIKGEHVFERAKKSKDEEAKKTLLMFFELLGTTLNHIASALYPEDGIILSGSILSYIKDDLMKDSASETSKFFSRFTATKSLKDIFEKIPIYYCSKEQLGLFGCKQFALQNLISNT